MYAIRSYYGAGSRKPHRPHWPSWRSTCSCRAWTPEQAKINIHAFRNSVKQFIFISSATVYNHKNNVVISESSPIGNEYSWYAGNKIQCEEIFLDAFKNSNFPVTIVRPSQTYSNDRIPLSVKGINCWSVIDRIINSKPVIVHRNNFV